jgi:hypothetical protein
MRWMTALRRLTRCRQLDFNQAIVNMVNQLSAQTAASIQAVATGDAATVDISAAAYAQQAAADN